jgi:acyl-CoA thioesterase
MKLTPQQIVERMWGEDAFSKELGMEILDLGAGFCSVRLHVKPSMVNGFSIAHGGITYSLSDSAMAFAANAHGKVAMSIETAISHVKKSVLGDILTAHCKELSRGKTVGRFEVEVKNQKDQVVALFKGTVFYTDESWG